MAKKKGKGHSKKARWGGIGKRFRPKARLRPEQLVTGSKKERKMARRGREGEREAKLCPSGHEVERVHLNKIGHIVDWCRVCGEV